MFDTAMQRVYTLISSIKPKLRLSARASYYTDHKSSCIPFLYFLFANL